VEQTRRHLAHRATFGGIWALLQAWGEQLIQFAVFVVLARLLGPEAYGVLALALVVTTAGDLLIKDAGWSEALIRKRDLDSIDLNSVFWFVLAVSAGLLVVATLIAAPFASWFGEPEVARILPWLGVLLPLSALTLIPDALLRRALEFRVIALRAVVGTLCGGVAGITLAVSGGGVWSLVVFQLTQAMVGVIVLWRACPWRPGLEGSAKRLAGNAGFVSGVFGDRIFWLVDFVCARVLIGQALGPVLLGYYSLAQKILELTRRMLVAPITRVAMPAFANVAPEAAPLREALLFSMQVSAAVAFPGFVGLAIVAPDIVPLLFGARWTPAVPAIQIAVLLGPILPLTRLSTALLLAVGRSRAVASVAALSTALFLVLLLLPAQLTVETVLAALVARSYLVLPLRFVILQRLIGVDLARSLRALAPIIAAGLVMTAAVLAGRAALPPDLAPYWRLGASVALGAIVYWVALMVGARPLLQQVVRLLSGAFPANRRRVAVAVSDPP
jgi:O-antigen/teichoic acid export membrane protein